MRAPLYGLSTMPTPETVSALRAAIERAQLQIYYGQVKK